ncbi:flavin reductase family protein [Aquimarina sp. W85]|uniref:flavin reductase family protein n=1 Tax=Aquimarina rhodophyticola TaxID=3342246 RepID=UPI00366B8D74
MIHYSRAQLSQNSSRFNANLINSCVGYKSCNIIATTATTGITNAAIFNSVIHLGSNPPILGFIMRPLTVARHTYTNIKDTQFFTVNHVTKELALDAHQTAAKYEVEESEFSHTNLEEEYLNNFAAPFVKNSPVRLACKYLNEYKIKENGTILMLGSIEHIYLDNDLIDTKGHVLLENSGTVASIGLDGYALPELLYRLSYAQPNTKIKKL